jgi:hypothetical protein
MVKYGWRIVIVVTFRPHISGARYTLAQCFDGDLVMIASPAHLSAVAWGFEYVYQTAGYISLSSNPIVDGRRRSRTMNWFTARDRADPFLLALARVGAYPVVQCHPLGTGPLSPWKMSTRDELRQSRRVAVSRPIF